MSNTTASHPAGDGSRSGESAVVADLAARNAHPSLGLIRHSGTIRHLVEPSVRLNARLMHLDRLAVWVQYIVHRTSGPARSASRPGR